MHPWDDVLTFWFGDGSLDEPVEPAIAKRWFRGGEAFDAEIQAQFGSTVERARAGELDAWAASPDGRLGLIIVLDQFSRNLFRNSPLAWSADDKARQLTVMGIDAGDDQRLPWATRPFFYMPLMHTEALDVQERSVEMFQQLVQHCPPEFRETFQNNLKYAVAHRDAIAEFGRFPHRNHVLERTSTVEEKAYLEGGGGF